ncbi:HNH endonuclease [Herbiconiux sp. CPCC 205716]|uniref:HNH endonuclease n=1 Tax=Herbiconiux gentiana TaxID=2970912 RepID=A0ABT2GEM9_9MICO|nr:HNH endonuclease signature motif containing protein [Herbiconiux gentiana]MCS5713745.1 HNH endonuclease [Herbiconiux gentiana]
MNSSPAPSLTFVDVSPSAVSRRESLLQGIGAEADAVAEIQREQAILEGRAVRHLAAAARKADRLAKLDGASLEHARRSLVAEIATTLRLPESTAAQRIDDAEMLCEFLPVTLDALTRGDLSYRHAQAVVRQARTLPEHARGEFEVVALAKAERQTAPQLSAHARVVRERMHPESIDTRHREARDERAVWLEKERDGMSTLVCHLPAVAATAIDDTLDQLGRALRAPDESRTHAQLRADSFVELLLHRDGDSDVVTRARGITANIAVTVPVLTFLGRSTEPAELHGYGPIDLDTARELAAAAPTFLRILTDPITGRRLSVGRDRYKVPADLRASVVLDDETCRFPGCTRSADRCDLDHVLDWAKGGETSLANLAALCRRHHTVKHHTDWNVTAGPDRTLHWTSPSGARHTTDPPPHGATAYRATRPTTRSASEPPPPGATPHPATRPTTRSATEPPPPGATPHPATRPITVPPFHRATPHRATSATARPTPRPLPEHPPF